MGEALDLSGLIGIGITTYNKVGTIYQTSYVQKLAPLERVRISMSIDKAGYTDRVSASFPGSSVDLNTNLVAVKVINKTGAGNYPTISEIQADGSTIPNSQLFDQTDGNGLEVKVMNEEFRLPASWNGTTWTRTYVWIFRHGQNTDYCIVPVELQVDDYESNSAPANRDVDLVAIEDQDGNPIALTDTTFCLTDGIETLKLTFQLDGALAPANNFNFIPIVGPEDQVAWTENNAFAHPAMNQLSSDFVIENDEAFSAGSSQASVTIDATRFVEGVAYAITGIAKEGNLSDPAPPVAGCDPSIQLDFTYNTSNWGSGGGNVGQFVLNYLLNVTSYGAGTVTSITVATGTLPPPIYNIFSSQVTGTDTMDTTQGPSYTPIPDPQDYSIEFIITVQVDFGGDLCTYQTSQIMPFTVPGTGNSLTFGDSQTTGTLTIDVT